MRISFRLVSISLAWAALGLCNMTWAQPASGAKPGHTMRHIGAPPTSVLAILYVQLLPMPAVQEELKLSEDQQAKVKEVADKAMATMRELFAGVRDLSPEEGQAKMEEAGKKMQAKAEETKKVIEGVLLPKQLERLKGLAMQMAGSMAIVDKEVQKDLKLSDDQVAKIKSAGEDLAKKANELRSEGADPKTVGQLRGDWEKQVMEVFTADQKASLEKMKGAKFAFPAFGARPASPPAKTPDESKGQP